LTPARTEWAGLTGTQWANRNQRTVEELDELYREQFNMPRTTMAGWILRDLRRDLPVLEVGCAGGVQLDLLRELGFTGELRGCDINAQALELCQHPAMVADACDLPYADDAFYMVFTSGTLMHIHYDDKPAAMKEMARVSDRYIWGFEWGAYQGKASTVDFEEGLLPPAYLLPVVPFWQYVVPDVMPLRVETWRTEGYTITSYLLDLHGDQRPVASMEPSEAQA